MSANLNSSTIKGAIKYSMSKALTGFGNLTLDTVEKSFSLSPAVTAANTAYIKNHSLAAAATATIDLVLDNDPFGDALTATKVLAIILVPTGTGAIAKIEPNATNGLTWFFAGTTPSVSVPAGGVFLYAEPSTGFTVSATVKQLKLTNTGSATGSFDVVILCKQ